MRERIRLYRPEGLVLGFRKLMRAAVENERRLRSRPEPLYLVRAPKTVYIQLAIRLRSSLQKILNRY